MPSPVIANVDIKNFTYQNVTVAAGSIIVWTNRDNARHTTTQDGRDWDSGVLATGESFSFSMSQPGVYRYFCNLHLDMKATVTVTPPGS